MALQKTQFRVPDIGCAGCGGTIKLALKKHRGVDDVDVDVDAKHVVVTYDPDETTENEIMDTVLGVGYSPVKE